MKTKLLTLISLVFFSFSGVAQISQALNDTLSKVFNQMNTSYQSKGVSVAIKFKDGSIWEKSYGNYDTLKLHGKLLYEAGSNTKTIIAATILLLEEEGKLSINDSIAMHLNGFKHPYINNRVTIKQLMNHTSGIFSYTDHPDFYPNINRNWNSKMPIDTIFKYFINAPRFAAGTKVEYCNTGYILLGRIIENVEQKPLHKVLKQKIFTPNKMNNTFLAFYDSHNQTHLGTWFDTIYEADPPVSFMSSAWAAGGIICHPADLANWAYNLYSGKVLSETSLNKMTTNWVTNNRGENFGLGVFKNTIYGKTFWGHGGKTLQSSAMDYSVNSEYSIVLMNIEDDTYSKNFAIRNRLIHIIESELPNIKIPDNTSIKNNDLNEVFKVYPNPAINLVHVELSQFKQYHYKLINPTGTIVLAGEGSSSSFKIEPQNQLHGPHWLIIESENGQSKSQPILFR